LLLSGKYFEALKEIQLIISIDPLSFPNYKRIGRLLYKMGQFETAINYLNDALELEPRDYVILAILGAAYTELGNYDKALSIFQKSLDCYFNIEIASMIGYVYALQGEKERALQIIRQIESEPEEISQPGIKQARIYMALGEKETAYKLLEQAYEQHNVDFMQINFDPRWNAIRHESRFKEIASRLRFPKD
jgi:tetratricopeptide (TPR) repeat protein